MGKPSPNEIGTMFWNEVMNKLRIRTNQFSTSNPVISGMLLPKLSISPEDFEKIHAAALHEVYCFAAYCSYVAGSKLFIKLMGYDRKGWVEFTEGVSKGMIAQVSALPMQDDDFFVTPEKAASLKVIQYMQTFTKGDAKANVAWILSVDKSTLSKTFSEFGENLENAITAVTPNGEYPDVLMKWCPDAEYIYQCAWDCTNINFKKNN